MRSARRPPSGLVDTGPSPSVMVRFKSVWCRVATRPTGPGHNKCAGTMPAVNDTNTTGTKKSRGGWRGSPNSIAALFAHQMPRALQRTCKRCRRLALRGRDWCYVHASRRVADKPGTVERRTLAGLAWAGLLPAELIQTPTWLALSGCEQAIRAPIRLRLVLLWHERERQPLAFADVWRLALAARSSARSEGRMQWRLT